MDYETTARGFIVYGRFMRTDGKTEIRLQEWSASGRPRVLLCTKPGLGDSVEIPDFDATTAPEEIKALQTFIDEPDKGGTLYFGDCLPDLDREEAAKLIDLFQRFLDHAGSPDNWRNDPSYIEQWGR